MNLNELSTIMDDFVNSKGWYDPDSARPQTPRNLAASLSIESAEVLELFQWQERPENIDHLASELADVALYLLQLARITGVDLEKSILEKLAINLNRNWDMK